MRKEINIIAWLFAATCLLPGVRASAQCDHIGWVASVTPGCGAKIIDLDNGQTYRAVSGAEGLIGGQTITFNAVSTPMPAGCPPGLGQVVALTCVSDTLPCAAHFGYYVDADDAVQFNFVANVYDASTQQCQWLFGDGESGVGRNVAHKFPHNGEYNVCLKVTDAFGCTSEYCETVIVDVQNSNWCGYDMKVTAVGTQLMGKVFSTDSASNNVLQSVYWYSSKSGTLLAQTPEFTAALPGFGKYLVCAQYTVTNADGSFNCSATRCQDLTVAEPGCVNPVMANANAVCPSQSALYAPVCGCNGVTYGNDCEAISAGVFTWWAGECSAQNTGCNAQMTVSIIDGSLDDGYTARFINQSAGDFTFSKLDFGDGSDLWEASNWDTLVHVYPAGGIYRTNLTTWKTGGCVSSAIQLLVTDALNMTVSSLPEGTDYVRPGDSNGDGEANVYDLLHLGVGHYTSGSPRPEATTAWTPQFSPNWLESVAQQVNYKHLDCDGNGAVNEYDADVIVQHYTPIDSSAISNIPNTPQVRIEFPFDTVVVDANNPAPLEIRGKVILGSPTQPALGIYGLAFGMEYPDYVGHNPEADYKSDFFGSPNHMLWLAKDNHSRYQLDLGLTRKNGQQVSGYGALAEITFRTDFIIIIDVTGRSDKNIIPFVVPIRGIRAIDKDGNVKYISTPAQADTVWIKLVGVTGTKEALERSVVVSPNPATNHVSLYVGDLNVTSVETVNVFGQVVSRMEPTTARNLELNVQDLPSGVYTLQLYTDKGLIQKQLVVE